jgi:hypothetical protein
VSTVFVVLRFQELGGAVTVEALASSSAPPLMVARNRLGCVKFRWLPLSARFAKPTFF